ncbi:ABC transporter ATP-binding protein [Paraburkholderia domus]|uniref:ABC transporter ATP-binding protein n=1 Tax=Paraburkholderia domus TaxID=2793075 RepID=UPI00191262FF|nr:ABC transporter ATP-binding protein [Paraburkholderia domus]MBK5065902.1 ABC transporter ATP-binding protein [Burkholderia sp. R-70199]CAE6959259.1 Putative 2-aminoethylphosphonate import ATP-binding protein PhnT [Paraburkholderia domus]
MPKIKLRLDCVSKTFGSTIALNPTTLEMGEGEFLTLLGPSGSGKTTLLSIVAGLTQPSSGDVWIDEQRATTFPSFKRGIGMVFQNYALFPHLTIFENIAFPLRMRKASTAEVDEKVRQILEMIKLPQVANRYPRELSGGQQQRIALARCMVYSPSIILMDEPLGALDKNLRDHMQLEIKRLHVDLGITILYVTHDQEEALAMSDRICLMNCASIEQIGSPNDLYFRPKTVFAAQFLGESNILPGKVTGVGDHIQIQCDDGHVVHSSATGRYAISEKLASMVRPENLQIVSPDSTLPNKLHGRVSDVVFAGGATKLHVKTSQGTTLVSRQPTTHINAPRQGDEICLGWRSEDTVLIQAETVKS